MNITHARPFFHVIAVISNPVRFASRYNLYRAFEQRMLAAGANLWTVELQQGERQFAVTDSANPRHIQLRTFDELWHKENMINIAIGRLPRDWRYVAWIDADIEPQRGVDEWLNETLQQLQHFQFVQMFQSAIDMGPTGETMGVATSAVYQYLHGAAWDAHYSKWHPGYAWAARREAIEATGGLIDTGILGAGDRHMCLALFGLYHQSIQKGVTLGYEEPIRNWAHRAEFHIRRNVGFVPGTIFHYFHGKKRDRRYHDRWQILVQNKFDPEFDLAKDWQGLWKLDVRPTFDKDGKVNPQEMKRRMKLRDDIRAYFRSRNEDSIDKE